jgi:hypothetical protein
VCVCEQPTNTPWIRCVRRSQAHIIALKCVIFSNYYQCQPVSVVKHAHSSDYVYSGVGYPSVSDINTYNYIELLFSHIIIGVAVSVSVFMSCLLSMSVLNSLVVHAS